MYAFSRLPFGRMAFLALLLGALTIPASAKDTKIILPPLSPGERQNLQNRQPRENYQLRQQLNRESDSQSIQQNQPRLSVPVPKPRCQPQPFGIGC